MILAQVNSFGDLLDKFDAGELIGLFAIVIVFTTVLVGVVVVTITRSIANVRIASINAKMVQTLAKQGHSAEEIERIVKGNSRGLRLCLPGRWQRAYPAELTNGKKPPQTVSPHSPA